MRVAVEKGADENLRFVEDVDYLERNSLVPVDSREWIDEICQRGLHFGAGAGGSLSGGSMSMPKVVVAPEPALVVRRENLADEGTARELVAELKRRFADLGAVNQR